MATVRELERRLFRKADLFILLLICFLLGRAYGCEPNLLYLKHGLSSEAMEDLSLSEFLELKKRGGTKEFQRLPSLK